MTIDFTTNDPQPYDGSHLTAEQVEIIEGYVAQLLDALELSYWRVYVARDLPPQGTLLMIQPTDGRRVAMLYVAADWWQRQTTEEKRSDLTHECLHLAHHDQEYVIRHWKNTNGDVASYVLDLLWEHFRVETERMVDSLSYVLAPHMPSWPEEEER